MSNQPFAVEEIKNVPNIQGARIIAVGVGGGGGNMIGHMIRENVTGIEMMVVNTDAQALQNSPAEKKVQIGVKLTKGLGAGMKPEIGEESALENEEEIRAELQGADIVFISAGLGGGTGTGAAPVVARIAKDVGALTVSVVTKPFQFEGKKRNRLALEGLEALKAESDSIVVIPNEKLISIIDRKAGLKDSFKIVDSVLAQAVKGTSGIILSSGVDDINVDFNDLRTVMSYKGMALMGVGEHQGENAAYEAIKTAIESPLLDNISINGAMGVLVHFQFHPNFPFMEIQEAMNVVYESVDEEADVIFGTSTDEALAEDYVKITIVATGFEKNVANNTGFESTENVVMQEPTVSQQQTINTQETTLSGRPRKIVGSDIGTFEYDPNSLDTPAYYRHRQD